MSDIKSVAEAIDKIATAFEEYKSTNDQRLDALKAGNGTAEIEEKLAKIEGDISQLEDIKAKLEKVETKVSRPGLFDGKRQDGESREQAEYRSAFLDWMRSPTDTERQQKAAHAYKKALETKATATVTSTGSAGGFALPEIIEREIARLSVDISPIRQIATVRMVGSPDYKELFDTNGAGFEWVGETGARSQTDTPDLAEVAPTFGTASAKPQASEESLDDLFFDVENWLITSAAEAIAQGEGAAFVSGNGTNKPTGFLAGVPVATTDATRAFGVLQYIASGQAAALPTNLDKFYDVVYSLRARYRNNARWVTSKLVLAAMRKYKDSVDGQYLWQPSLVVGQPSTFMGYPVVEAEDMPAVAANAFSVAFGDFREGYLVADRVGMRVTRDEITTPGYVKFYVRKRVGGIIRNSEAIKLMKIAAS